MPGKIRPGFHNSTTIPIRPIESIRAMMLGSIKRSSMRFQADISIRSTVVSGGVSMVRPFGFVVIPSSWRKRSA